MHLIENEREMRKRHTHTKMNVFFFFFFFFFFVYLAYTYCLGVDPCSQDGLFMVRKMAITSPIPVFYGLK